MFGLLEAVLLHTMELVRNNPKPLLLIPPPCEPPARRLIADNRALVHGHRGVEVIDRAAPPFVPTFALNVLWLIVNVLLWSLKMAPPNLAALPMNVLLFATRRPRLRTAPPLIPQSQLSRLPPQRALVEGEGAQVLNGAALAGGAVGQDKAIERGG